MREAQETRTDQVAICGVVGVGAFLGEEALTAVVGRLFGTVV